MTSTSDWLHFHQSNNPSAASQTPYATTATTSADLFFPGRASDAAAVSTNMNPINNPPPTGPAQLGPTPSRVSKPARKRTRASRRTPTTLLNTDTSNFRAMVQQFTGGSNNNFDIPGPSPQMFGNGMGRGYGLHNPMAQLQQQQQLTPLQYSLPSNNHNNSNNNNNNIMFMQRIGENFTTQPHDHGTNINMNMRLTGNGGGSSSSENRSMDNFHF